MTSWRIILRRTVLSTMLGLATTLGVAWTLARRARSMTLITAYEEVLPPPPTGGRYGEIAPDLVVCEGRGVVWIRTDLHFSGEQRAWSAMSRPGLPADERTVPRCLEPFVAPWRAELRRTGIVTTPLGGGFAVLAAGWPIPVVRTLFHAGDTGLMEREPIAWDFAPSRDIAAVSSAHFTPAVEMVPRIVPLIPLWRNLALSTMLYGAPWATLLTMIVHARERTRRRRGLCPNCAYDLSATPPDSPCPECGRTHHL